MPALFVGQGFLLSVVVALTGCSLVYDTSPLTSGSTDQKNATASAGTGGVAGTAGSVTGSAGMVGSVAGGAGTGATTAGTGAGPSAGGSAGTMPEDGGSAGAADADCFPDGDGDGYGDAALPAAACSTQGYVEVHGDCDDGDSYAHPALSEVCDGIDNDCDPATTEVCPLDCEVDDHAGRLYLHCWEPQTAAEASALCAEQLMRLARIDDVDEQDYLFEWHMPQHSWTGGSDAVSEGIWAWEDGQVLWDHGVATLYQAWGGSEPNNLSGLEHCLMLNGDWNHWNDHECSNPQSFVCERY